MKEMRRNEDGQRWGCDLFCEFFIRKCENCFFRWMNKWHLDGFTMKGIRVKMDVNFKQKKREKERERERMLMQDCENENDETNISKQALVKSITKQITKQNGFKRNSRPKKKTDWKQWINANNSLRKSRFVKKREEKETEKKAHPMNSILWSRAHKKKKTVETHWICSRFFRVYREVSMFCARFCATRCN